MQSVPSTRMLMLTCLNQWMLKNYSVSLGNSCNHRRTNANLVRKESLNLLRVELTN